MTRARSILISDKSQRRSACVRLAALCNLGGKLQNATKSGEARKSELSYIFLSEVRVLSQTAQTL